jgi:uncharacterized protein YpmB
MESVHILILIAIIIWIVYTVFFRCKHDYKLILRRDWSDCTIIVLVCKKCGKIVRKEL